METLNGSAPEVARDNQRGYAPTIIAAGVIIAILYWARIVFITAMISVITALILEPFVSLLVRIRLPRALASFLVCVVALLALWFTGFAAYQQLSSMASDVPAFRENLANFVENVTGRIQDIEDASARIFAPTRKPPAPAPAKNAAKKTRRSAAMPLAPPLPPLSMPGIIPEVRIHSDPVTDYIYAQLGTLYRFALMSSFVPLLVYFMLSWRDHVYQSFLYFFDASDDRQTAARSLQGIAGMARAFVVGNFVIGVMLAAASSVLFAAIHLRYPFLIGSLSGFLSLVPYAGVFLAVIPPLLAALATGAPSASLLFSVVIAVALHLIAMNILYPTVVGARVHLNPLVVTISLMFWGFLWDAAGLLLAIPITAGLKAVCDNVAHLKNYGRLLGD